MEWKEKATNHHEIELPHGKLHVFANEYVRTRFEDTLLEMADNNLRIPRNVYMSYTPDVHVGVGTCIGTTAVWRMKDGCVSPSIVGQDIGCGMRVHLTPLHKNDIQDPRVRQQLINTIEQYVPTQERSNGHYGDTNMMNVIQFGLHGLPASYLRDPTSLSHVESEQFPFDPSHLEFLPNGMTRKAHAQLGTLGKGNHFCEIQTIQIAEDHQEIAKQWGLFDGQVVVMIHSGSRAWGTRLGKEFTMMIRETMAKWGVSNPDPNLIFAPIDSREGERYLNLMYSAMNYATVNRHLIAYSVRQAFTDVFGDPFEMPLLYDLMHNYAGKEFYRNEPMLVHRKGTTRALPAGHYMNRPAYKASGHPALVPGSMGTASYIMVGQSAGEKNFYSICHGAGRALSRTATRQAVSINAFQRSLHVGSAEEIMVNQRRLESILDECPQAYKDVDQIIDSIVGAGLATVVATCYPMASIKGT